MFRVKKGKGKKNLRLPVLCVLTYFLFSKKTPPPFFPVAINWWWSWPVCSVYRAYQHTYMQASPKWPLGSSVVYITCLCCRLQGFLLLNDCCCTIPWWSLSAGGRELQLWGDHWKLQWGPGQRGLQGRSSSLGPQEAISGCETIYRGSSKIWKNYMICQEDNALIHTAGFVKLWFDEQADEVSHLPWAP